MAAEDDTRGGAGTDATGIDTTRGEQLRILDDCQLPKKARDKEGHGVSAQKLKWVLRAIDSFGRGRRCWPAVGTIAERASVGPRTVTRAIAVLQDLGLLLVEPASRHGQYGAPTSSYVIVWSELAARGRTPLERASTRPSPGPNHSAPDANHRALGTDQSAPGANHRAPGGAQTVQEAQSKRTPPSPPAQPSASAANSWREVEEVLVAMGLKAARKAVREAKRRGLDRTGVLSLAAHFREHAAREKWGPGLLFYAVTSANPGEQPRDIMVTTMQASPTQPKAEKQARQERASRALAIIRQGRSRRQTEEEIHAALAAVGCQWSDVDCT